MSKIIKVDATEELLKFYFFKLYSRKGEIELNFDEETIHTIIVSNTIKTIKSADLFKCCSIEYRWGDEPIEIPNSFYYFEKEEILDNSIQNHPFLYTNIKTINNTSLVEAEINLQHSGSDIYDDNNNFLEFTISPNLYDNGNVNIEYLAQNIFSVYYYDENNGERYELFLFKENRFHSINSYEGIFLEKKTILQLLSLENCPPLLKEASETLQADKEVVLAAVSQNGLELEFASKELQNDREVVLAAVKNFSVFGNALEFASEELRSDREVVLEAVKKDGTALEYASDDLRSDPDIVLVAVIDFVIALQYASDDLRSDRNVILAAVKNDGGALKYASEELKSDREFVLEAVKNSSMRSAFKFCSKELSNDIEFIIESSKLDIKTIGLVDSDLISKHSELQELYKQYKSKVDNYELPF